jgi:hypothetical protein
MMIYSWCPPEMPSPRAAKLWAFSLPRHHAILNAGAIPAYRRMYVTKKEQQILNLADEINDFV